MASRLGRNHRALRYGIVLRADDLEVNGPIVMILVEHPDVTDQVDIASTVGL
jgi:hypothetical protein